MSSGAKSQSGGSGESQLPPGFRDTTKKYGQGIKSFITDPRFSDTLNSALDFYSGSDIQNSLNVFRQQQEDPFSFTNPLFQQQRESLGGNLVERGRQIGGLDSSSTQNLLGQGLGEFTNQYLSGGFARQNAATQGLMGVGQSLFTPFQAMTGALSGIAGRAPSSGGQQQYGNTWGSTLQTIGEAYGSSKTMGNPY